MRSIIFSFLSGLTYGIAGIVTLFLIAYFTDSVLLINDTANLFCDKGKVNVTRTAFIRVMNKPKNGDECLMPVGKK